MGVSPESLFSAFLVVCGTFRVFFSGMLKLSFLLPAAALFALISHAPVAHAQEVFTTESLTVKAIAPGAPDFLAELAKADDYREPTTSAQVEAKPYSLARADFPLRSHGGRSTAPLVVGRQPAGSLTGKIVFAMAGHGWTYDSDRMFYYTQRGLSHGMVEDMGNADQMHIFAHLAFNSGATVVPLRPVDSQPHERIIDNTMHQVQFYGDWRAGSSDRYFGDPEDKVPYAVAEASLIESAVARYRPYIPEAGYYPVYVWARDGADRSNQLYRVCHSGGVDEVRVNWRQLGKTWVWLGTYYFERGMVGCVEISNQVIDPYEAYSNHVIVADAVRFGNGAGDVPRPGGISGFLREDEGDSYWIERSLGVGADRRLFDVGRDGNSTISSPPKAAAHINRELVDSYLDRVLISFHSNASTGKARGALSLYNASVQQRPSYQESLAELTGAEVNAQMLHDKPPAGEAWMDRLRNTYSGINFGELRRDYIQNEMAATIVETAFHDNAEDVTFLLDPVSRIRMAEATLRGVFRWRAGIVNPTSVASMPPARPAGVFARVAGGKVQVTWVPSEVGHFEGGASVRMRVFRSANGYGFDGGVDFAAADATAALDLLSTSGVTFLRVCAVNEAGQSLPSQTVAVSAGGNGAVKAANTLLVSANTVLDRSTNVPYALGTQPGGGPYRESAVTERVRALYAMTEPAGAGEALALAAAGVAFDGADTVGWQRQAAEAKLPYKRLFIAAEQQNPAAPLLPAPALEQLRQLLSAGGSVFLSGTGVVDNLLTHQGKGRFVADALGIKAVSSQEPGAAMQSASASLLPTTAPLSLRTNTRPWAGSAAAEPAGFTLASGRGTGLLLYAGAGPGEFAAIRTPVSGGKGQVTVLGFPLSLLQTDAMRRELMAGLLDITPGK